MKIIQKIYKIIRKGQFAKGARGQWANNNNLKVICILKRE